MTGRLNPRRYDLGELRDVSRDRSRRPEPDRVAEDRPAGASDLDDGTAVPVETTEAGGEAETGTVKTETGASPPKTGEAETDDVEAYLRSRHRRRETGNERGRPAADRGAAGDRAAERNREDAGDRQRARQRSPGPQAGREDDYSPNAAAFLAELSGSQLSKPYLDRLPDAYSAQLEVFEWLERLLESGGRDATLSALEYYESIGWLSERSRGELEDVVAGLSAEESVSASLCLDDHRESLLYVARLSQRRTQ